jgi:hypothetical protein
MPNHSLSLHSWERMLVSSLDILGTRLQVRLDPPSSLICSNCRSQAYSIYKTVWRTVRDLPMAGLAVFIDTAVNSVRDCGVVFRKSFKSSNTAAALIGRTSGLDYAFRFVRASCRARQTKEFVSNGIPTIKRLLH